MLYDDRERTELILHNHVYGAPWAQHLFVAKLISNVGSLPGLDTQYSLTYTQGHYKHTARPKINEIAGVSALVAFMVALS